MKAMILAAGLGTRMGALTRDLPKPLLAVDGEPLIAHRVRALVAAGFTDLVVNVAYLGEQIEAALGDGSRFGARIDYSREPDGPLGTGGGIKRALPRLGPQPFVLVNADVRCDYPLSALRRPLAGLAHLVLVDNPDHNAAGDFALLPHGRVANQGQTMLTFAGVSVIDPRLLDGATGDNFSLTPLLRRAADAGQVTGEHHAGAWLDVGTPDRLARAQGAA
ncbi:MAG: N-acetylmuramate alpha-1-phosphate uridylyltransferase MurU [Immundisolibacter sp.]|uniref:N-acetylmuramate alpha-1-phosphate uridylyltransferase MurU n=1 Tax=Immundisolibacter sp. TaxID=1934948 RepID=UPI003D138E6D